jgi:DNA-binding transcriptional LysR family regulator
MPDIRFGYHGSTALAERYAAAARTPVDLVEYDVADPFRELRAGRLDVMIVKFRLDEPDLGCTAVLDTDPRGVLVRAGHPLTAWRSVSVEQVADYAGFHRPGAMPDYVWDEVMPATTPAGRPLRRVHELTSTGDLMRIIAGSDAVHLSLCSLADIAPPSVRVVPVHDLPPAGVSIAWSRGRHRPDVIAFLRAVEDELAPHVTVRLGAP